MYGRRVDDTSSTAGSSRCALTFKRTYFFRCYLTIYASLSLSKGGRRAWAVGKSRPEEQRGRLATDDLQRAVVMNRHRVPTQPHPPQWPERDTANGTHKGHQDAWARKHTLPRYAKEKGKEREHKDATVYLRSGNCRVGGGSPPDPIRRLRMLVLCCAAQGADAVIAA